MSRDLDVTVDDQTLLYRNVRNIKKLSDKELEMGHSGSASWHHMYKDSSWIFIGGLNFDLTEGDIICVFSQFGEVVNINLVREKQTGKSRGFAFLCYEDQRSTILAVDNLNGIQLVGRTIRVDHVENYKLPKEHEDMDDVTKRLQEEGCAPKPIPLNIVKTEVKKEIKHGKDGRDRKHEKGNKDNEDGNSHRRRHQHKKDRKHRHRSEEREGKRVKHRHRSSSRDSTKKRRD